MQGPGYLPCIGAVSAEKTDPRPGRRSDAPGFLLLAATKKQANELVAGQLTADIVQATLSVTQLPSPMKGR